MSRRAVITGVGAVTPLGVGADALIDRWVAGDVGIVDGAGACSDFDPANHLSRKEIRRNDRFTQFAIAASNEALASAGWNGEKPVDSERIGCVIGTGIGGIGVIESQHIVLREQGAGQVSPLSIPLLMPNAAAGAVAMAHGLRGQCFGTVSACAAGANAIGTALRMLQYGDADAVVVGGTESALTPLSEAAFGAMAATSPTGISRPFDARRDGFVMGEGAAVMVLETEEGARERGADLLGVVAGYGATADAHHIVQPEPTGAGAARAIELALADADAEPGEIDYVNAHGTSTGLNDRAETEAIKLALGESAYSTPISSTKSTIGHLLGAAGAVEAVATVLALRRGLAPPTLGWAQRDEGLDLDYVPDGPRELPVHPDRPRRAISNSFGFGGHNAVLCLEAAA